MSTARLQCTDLTITINDRELVRALTLDVAAGDFVCMLGTNGVGKTLTLQTLAGLRAPATGELNLCGSNLAELTRREIARKLGMLLQIHEDAFPLTVMESVMLGRYPHMSLWQWPNDADKAAVREALQKLDLVGLEERPLAELSGGERERAALAALWVQDPDIWLLDEPMNHLDPQHQLHVLRLLAATAARGKVVLASLHNPALAMRFASHALLFYGDGEWEYGPAAELLEPARLEHVYGTPFEYFRNGDRQLLVPA